MQSISIPLLCTNCKKELTAIVCYKEEKPYCATCYATEIEGSYCEKCGKMLQDKEVLYDYGNVKVCQECYPWKVA